MIEVHQRPLESTRTPNSACKWEATCCIDGRTFTAQSRHGAPHELARQLVAAGIPDDAMRVVTAGLRGHMEFASFHAAARYTISEGVTGGPQRTRWQDMSAVFSAKRDAGEGQIEGETTLPAMAVPPTETPPFLEDFPKPKTLVNRTTYEADARESLSGLSDAISEARAAGARTIAEIAAALNVAGMPSPAGGHWHLRNTARVIDRLAEAAA